MNPDAGPTNRANPPTQAIPAALASRPIARASDEGAGDHAMPLPATSADERHAADPVESDESIAGEEDPGAAVDEGAGDRPRGSSSTP